MTSGTYSQGNFNWIQYDSGVTAILNASILEMSQPELMKEYDTDFDTESETHLVAFVAVGNPTFENWNDEYKGLVAVHHKIKKT